MVRQSRKFKIFAAIITIPLFAVFLFGYSFIIFMYADGLSNIKHYLLLGLGFIGILLWVNGHQNVNVISLKFNYSTSC